MDPISTSNELTIIDNLRDRNLLGWSVKDLTTFKAWLTVLRAFFALHPEPGDLDLFKQCTGRTLWPSAPSSELWLAVGVRSGKSFVTALTAVYFALFKKHQLSRGERGHVIVVAPTLSQARIVKRYISGFLAAPLLKPYVIRETSDEIELSNFIVISCTSSDYRTLRGYTAICCIVDEVAYLQIEGSKPDTEVIRALRSRLLTTDGKLIVISSPYSMKGMLYEVDKKHFGVDHSPILFWRAASRTMNPTLSANKINQALAEDSAAARSDYLAEYRDDFESYVSRETLDQCVIKGRLELKPQIATSYRAFVDPSGGSADHMTLAVCHKSSSGRLVLDLLTGRGPPFSPDAVVAEFASVLARYRVREVTGDRYAGEWPKDRFRAYGITYKAADLNKSQIYLEFLPLINSREIELLDDELLVNQILTLERRTGRTGRDNIDHPMRGHDDYANAAAGGLTLFTGKHRRIGIWGEDTENRRVLNFAF